MEQNIATQTMVDEIATLLIPLEQKQLLLPNVAVAEIVPYSQPESVDGAPNWLLGKLLWRNVSVPMVCLELLNGESAPTQLGSGRIAIFNGLNDSSRLPFVAVLIRGVPRQMRVVSDELALLNEVIAGPVEAAVVSVAGERASIPDLDYVEAEILKHI